MITRRGFTKAGGLALFAAGIGGVPSFLTRAARAATAAPPVSRRKTVVAVFQRGAMDGLAAVQPLADPYLAALRPRLVLRPSREPGDGGLLALSDGYGLHPALAPLLPFYQEGQMAVVHGVGSPVPTRSHFDAQAYMETGAPGDKSATSGWLNRAVGLAGHDAHGHGAHGPADTPFRAVAVGPSMPRALTGPAPAVAIASLDRFTLPTGTGDFTADGLDALYRQTAADVLGGDVLQAAGRESLDASTLIGRATARAYRPEHGAEYPRQQVGQRLRQVAHLVKLDVGLEVAFVEMGGWDTHVRQARSFERQAAALGQALAAFWTDLGDRRDDVVLMTMTEFGRSVSENGSGGTGHGRASCLFVLGTGIDGGTVHGEPFVLAHDTLEDGRDLPVSTDFRAVFASVAQGHLGVPLDPPPGTAAADALFPGWAGRPLPLFRG